MKDKNERVALTEYACRKQEMKRSAKWRKFFQHLTLRN